MNEADIYTELTQIFRDQLRSPALLIGPAMTPDDVPGWDSAAMVAIIMSVEEQFGREFSRRELQEFRSVGDLVRLIRRSDA